jgi:DNA polymerase III subunit delta'
MGFAELIGHTKQLDALRAALANQRLHHAYLFIGPEGAGKRTIATSLAKAIHCSELSGDYCDHCANCASIIDGNHPDVRLVQPLAGKKEISINQARDIERELRYRSFSGKRKIAIVDPAAWMNVAAQNALLKTLEEPPENSLIVLITPNAGGLLPTLRSRCLRLSFAPLPRNQVAAFLKAKHNIEAGDAEFLAAMSMGSIGVATNLDQAALVEKRRIWIGMLRALKARDYRAAIAAAEALAENRDETLEFLRWAESWYRDLLIHGITHRPDDLVNLDMLPQIEAHSGIDGGTDRALAALARIGAAAAGIQRNLNRRMVMEKLLFGLVEGR